MAGKFSLENIETDCFEEMFDWNDSNVAFIKHDFYEGRPMWLICGADGEKIAATDNREYAFIVAKQNDLTPCSVH